MGLFNMSFPGASCGMVCETGILLVIEATWEFRNAAWLVCFPGSCIVCAAIELRTGLPKSGVLKVREIKKSAALGAV